MKKRLVVFTAAVMLVACTDNGASVHINADSTGKKVQKELDTLGNKLEEKAGEIGEKADDVWDSTKKKAKDLKIDIEDKLNNGKDNRKK